LQSGVDNFAGEVFVKKNLPGHRTAAKRKKGEKGTPKKAGVLAGARVTGQGSQEKVTEARG